jgi:hypothetical protein
VRRAAALVVVASLAVPTAAEVTVRVQPGPPGSSATVELLARSAPLAEVLDRLGRQIGMKVVYEGAQPRQLVTLSLQGRSAVETVLGLLEGQGLNFALATDTTGTRVETLLVAGSAPASAPGASSTAAASAPTSGRGAAPAFRRPAGPPPGAGPDMIDADPEELEDEVFDEPAADPSEGAPAPGDPAAGSPPPSQAPGMPPVPGQSFPVSPFAPQATPYTPQPFPPLPPGAPGGPTPTPAPRPQPETPARQPPPD